MTDPVNVKSLPDRHRGQDRSVAPNRLWRMPWVSGARRLNQAACRALDALLWKLASIVKLTGTKS
jgi:hypothetical protein